ncbi:MAG: hypothetical protein PHU93_04310, partial [Candidatus Gracilibacteria bacterium]|nr:hypothetical protein [Candidatus Gracilibacteria bacterium]
KYFGETFRYIEKLDPYRFDKLTYQEKLELLEIAGIERDRAMQMERPRLIKASYRHQKNIQSLVRDILEFRHFWNSSEYPLSSQHFKDEASVTHPSLGDTRSARESPSKFSRLGGLEYKKAIQNQSYVKEVDTILSEFRFEEQELINRLNRWLGMKKMYLPADISEFLPGAISSKKP